MSMSACRAAFGAAFAVVVLSMFAACGTSSSTTAVDAGVGAQDGTIATLKRLGRNHLLVVESGAPQGLARVRGVISRSQIERQLGTAIDLAPIANSFSEIERALV